MIKTDGDYRLILFYVWFARRYSRNMNLQSSRFVAVNLTDAEWQALRSVTPDPCAWMKEQIDRLLDESGATPVREPQEHLYPTEIAD
jgi:hypothetical protein